EVLCLFVETLALFGLEQCTEDDRNPDLRTEIVFVVKLVHHLHQVISWDVGIFDVCDLVSAGVYHVLFVDDEAVRLGVIVELGAGISVGDGDLDGLDVKFLGEVDGTANGFTSLAGETEDEVAVNDESEFFAVLYELTGALDGGAFLDVLENLRIAGFEADDEQAATGFLHGLERLVVGSDARGAGPGEPEGLELGAEFDGARLLNVKGVVVEEELFHVGEEFLCLLHLGGNVVAGAFAPWVSAECLRPEAEGALGGASAGAIQGDERMKQERYVVATDIEIARVDFSDVRQRIEVADGLRIRIVGDD